MSVNCVDTTPLREGHINRWQREMESQPAEAMKAAMQAFALFVEDMSRQPLL